MQLVRLRVHGYRSLADFELEIRPLNVLIGANAAGKSNVLDVLRFLSQAIQRGDYADAVNQRGGFAHLAWKGARPHRIVVETAFSDGPTRWQWQLAMRLDHRQLVIDEMVTEERPSGPPRTVLEATGGRGWWWSEDDCKRQGLDVGPTGCSLASAAANTAFAGRDVAAFVRGWTFFDPHPGLLRRAASVEAAEELDSQGGNLAARLYRLCLEDRPRYERILQATRSILGVPEQLEFKVSTENGRVYFVQHEEGLRYPVHQVGASSGTLRMLALITALLGSSSPALVGIEEPENHLHPNAIDGLVQVLVEASHTHQVLVTTHWPPLLDGLEDPTDVCVIRRDEQGSHAERHDDRERLATALRESGLNLGEYFESTGFGA